MFIENPCKAKGKTNGTSIRTLKIQTDDFQFNPKENFRKPNMFIENPCNTLGKPKGKPRFPLKTP